MSEALAVINSDKMREELAKLLDSKPMIDRAIRLGTSALNNPDPNNKLPMCSGASFASAFIKSIQLNLEPNTVLGHCYLIPRQNKGKWEATFELGYKGLIELAYRSGQIKLIQSHEVKENDIFDVDYGESKLIHKPLVKGSRGEVIGYWARYFLIDGTSDFAYWSKEDVEKHRDKYSKSAGSNYSPWSTAFDQMAKKTVIKDALRYASMSSQDMRHAMAADGTVVDLEESEFQDIKSKPTMLDVVSKPKPQKAMFIAEEKAQESIDIDIDDEERKRMDVFHAVEKIIKTRKDAGAVEAELENTIGYKLDEVEAQTMQTLLEIAKRLK